MEDYYNPDSPYFCGRTIEEEWEARADAEQFEADDQ